MIYLSKYLGRLGRPWMGDQATSVLQITIHSIKMIRLGSLARMMAAVAVEEYISKKNQKNRCIHRQRIRLDSRLPFVPFEILGRSGFNTILSVYISDIAYESDGCRTVSKREKFTGNIGCSRPIPYLLV